MTVPSAPFPLVLSAPSGAGKTTIAGRLRERRADVVFSVSATTRSPRPGERDGVHYHFVDVDEFRRMIAGGELLEHAEVHGNFYGTPRSELRRAHAAGAFLLLDIDVQGAAQVRAAVPEAVLVFILPPSGRVLVQRLTGRGSEADEAVRRRLRNARDEIAEAPRFDHVVLNDELDHAVADVEAILDGRAGAVRPHPPLDGLINAIAAEIERNLGSDAG
ncbi:guanylate kinase [Longimicrobium terrae]|uniref:Guanylate kinase n=1 Tax=Longimicrobium terrae TaxID=1639882 RepID=A0A841H513_9BACT|nr:guanylate kinase [Longimicrobium terrae]MBB6072976.1 guanylate kinase [Longimicrobium terrae]